jgi:PAS domain S-box-containing protein
VVEFQRDISERKRQERHLKKRANRYRGLFERSSAVMLLIDPSSGSIVDANRAATEFYGWSVDQLKTMHIQDINTMSPDEVKRAMAQTRARGRQRFRFTHRVADGTTREVEVLTGPVQEDRTTLLHSVVMAIGDPQLNCENAC